MAIFFVPSIDGLVCSLPLPAGFYLMILAGFKTADYILNKA
jgi:hypothetical protein